MQHTLLGPERFRRGMDLYFERHDGQAVTCDDFVQAMQDASGVDLAQFRRWYAQAGTPVVRVARRLRRRGAHATRSTLAQRTPADARAAATRRRSTSRSRSACVGPDGRDLPLRARRRGGGRPRRRACST